MCGSIQFELAVEGAPDRATLEATFPDLLRIVFELVRNAVRHGRPTRVSVHLEAIGDLRLRVTDDGRGFQGAEAATSEGGLSNVRRRVDDLGGHVTVASDTDGTSVEVVLPVMESVPGLHDDNRGQ
jgi:signal transduction histidine kinase